jgi:alkylated DNA repair protein alkB homolog 8
MIQGLTIIPSFIKEEKEREILSHIRPSSVKIGQDRNTIKRFGSKLPYKASNIKEIPAYLQELCQRIHDDGWVEEVPDSVTINEYKAGQKIDWHIDSLSSGPVICVLSLMGNATMGMRRGTDTRMYDISARSLLIMEEEARYQWEHSIYPVKEDRFSIVFRRGTLWSAE